MDRIAILSDIHGNVPALEAVLEDIRMRDVTRIYCLGDLVGKGPESDLTVDLVRDRCERIVRGNWDDFVPNVTDSKTINWHQQVLGKERLAFLHTLPFVIEEYISGRYVRLFHASPRSLYERIQPWDEEEKRMSLFAASEWMMEQVTADVVGYGDIHQAYLQHLPEGKTLFNTGSVGNPLDLTQASYVILEGVCGSKTPGPFGLQFVRVPYDIERAVQLAVRSAMPEAEAYINELRTAKYRGLKPKLQEDYHP
ncbi:metallophosphoesterase family protein [Gorillibacterium timonense]|uniref:metallophosphoesterase family protein n=1 Tax=Gorillibacterium timonense TaxID=1689269 RepID=UPI00071D53BD|nr:metallophosphoesterase family protein [Gorillibacterium timonense]